MSLETTPRWNDRKTRILLWVCFALGLLTYFLVHPLVSLAFVFAGYGAMLADAWARKLNPGLFVLLLIFGFPAWFIAIPVYAFTLKDQEIPPTRKRMLTGIAIGVGAILFILIAVGLFLALVYNMSSAWGNPPPKTTQASLRVFQMEKGQHAQWPTTKLSRASARAGRAHHLQPSFAVVPDCPKR